MAESISPPHLSGAASFGHEWPALLECASPTRDHQRLAGLLRPADWARLLVLAEEHGVAGHLAASLRDLEENLVPLEIRQTLVDRQRAHVFLTLKLTAELFSLLERFTSDGICALVVKGPVLAGRAYGVPCMRNYSALDLLLRPKELSPATQVTSASS